MNNKKIKKIHRVYNDPNGIELVQVALGADWKHRIVTDGFVEEVGREMDNPESAMWITEFVSVRISGATWRLDRERDKVYLIAEKGVVDIDGD